MILFEKFCQHQPLNRQSERYARAGIDLSLSTLADHVAACAAALAAARVDRADVLVAERLNGDDTTVPILAKGKTDTGRVRVYVRNGRAFRWRGRLRRCSTPRATAPVNMPNGISPVGAAFSRQTRIAVTFRTRRHRRQRGGKECAGDLADGLEAAKRIDAIFDVALDINGLSTEERLRVQREACAPLVGTLEAWLCSRLAPYSRAVRAVPGEQRLGAGVALIRRGLAPQVSTYGIWAPTRRLPTRGCQRIP